MSKRGDMINVYFQRQIRVMKKHKQLIHYLTIIFTVLIFLGQVITQVHRIIIVVIFIFAGIKYTLDLLIDSERSKQ